MAFAAPSLRDPARPYQKDAAHSDATVRSSTRRCGHRSTVAANADLQYKCHSMSAADE
jgi:hypothetical protein